MSVSQRKTMSLTPPLDLDEVNITAGVTDNSTTIFVTIAFVGLQENDLKAPEAKQSVVAAVSDALKLPRGTVKFVEMKSVVRTIRRRLLASETLEITVEIRLSAMYAEQVAATLADDNSVAATIASKASSYLMALTDRSFTLSAKITATVTPPGGTSDSELDSAESEVETTVLQGHLTLRGWTVDALTEEKQVAESALRMFLVTSWEWISMPLESGHLRNRTMPMAAASTRFSRWAASAAAAPPPS